MVLTPPTAPPSALWVVPVSDLAGVARHVVDVVRAGIPGWRVVVLTPPGPLPQRLRELDAHVVEAAFGPGHGLRASVATLRDVVRRERPAVVHSHLAHADIVAALAVGRGPRLVTTEHGIARDDVVYHRSSTRRRVMAAAHTARLRRFHAAIAVSRATCARLGLGDAVTLPGFVDPDRAMADHDVLAMLSVWENCSYALLDAAARGMGVVASDVGGNT